MDNFDFIGIDYTQRQPILQIFRTVCRSLFGAIAEKFRTSCYLADYQPRLNCLQREGRYSRMAGT